jgi:hypothetical protein
MKACAVRARVGASVAEVRHALTDAAALHGIIALDQARKG